MHIARFSTRKNNRQTGFTLIEILVVLGIFGTLAFFVARYSGQADSKGGGNALTQQALVVIDGIKSNYGYKNFTGLTAQNACAGSVVPKDMCSGSGASTVIRHDLAGNITPAPANCGGTANCFSLSFTSVPGSACGGFVKSLNGKAAIITIGTTPVKNASLAYSQATANTACDADTVTIAMTIDS